MIVKHFLIKEYICTDHLMNTKASIIKLELHTKKLAEWFSAVKYPIKSLIKIPEACRQIS